MYDVAVVGSGPVGMVMAGLLAKKGIDVCVVEKHSSLFNLPRAANFDGETMRTFDRLGIASEILPKLYFEPKYQWRNGEGELLHEIVYTNPGKSGWGDFYQMYQPDIEAALHKAAAGFGADFRFGTSVTGYAQHAGHVEILTNKGTLESKYVVACDGGNSLTRKSFNVNQTDLGFSEPWLVCDFKIISRDRILPRALQVGDPLQPVSIIGLGHNHHRFSFMLDGDQNFEEARQPGLVWQRVKDYLAPSDAELIRVATYTFSSLLADTWRQGRIFLAGDAAHQMPPFLGQGMVSGIRDAQNLAFKFDLVLSELAPESILDTYQSERYPHVEAITRRGVELGRVQTIRDPFEAAARDERMRTERHNGKASEGVISPALGQGVFAEREQHRVARGRIMPHGRVLADDGEPTLLDHVAGDRRFTLITKDRISTQMTHPLVTTIAIGERGFSDLDQVYANWFKENGVSTVLVRPDGYIFGSVEQGGSPDLVLELDQSLDRAESAVAK